MALVAYDLDNTLGYFGHISPWGDVFSLDTLENSFNKMLNPHFHLSRSLRTKLQSVEKRFLYSILNDPKIVRSILRPNLESLILPILHAKRQGIVRAVCIYSNTWSTYAVHLGKELIEAVFECPGFFDCVVDASDPIRRGEYKKVAEREACDKTFKVLRSIFRERCGVESTIRQSDILFVDERRVKHVIQEDEVNGLVYLRPTVYAPFISDKVKRRVYKLGIRALEEEGLLHNREFLESDVFNVLKFGDNGSYVPVQGIHQLLMGVEVNIREAGLRGIEFQDDSRQSIKVIEYFLGRWHRRR